MTPKEWGVNIDKAKNYLENEFNREFTLLAVNDMGAAIRNRVQNKGLNSKGNKFRPYSTRPTLVGKSSFMNESTFASKILPEVKKIRDKQKQLQGKIKDNTSLINNNYTWVTTISGHRLVVLLGGYKKIRQIEGLQTQFKSFTRTGQMWMGFKIKSQTKKSFILGGFNELSQKLIDVNSQREKDSVIAPNDAEIDILTKYVSDNVVKKLKEFNIFQ